MNFETIERAVADIKAGKAVVVVDDEDRENEGDLIFAAELATPELLSFMVRYTSGYICVPLTEAECDRLDLPPMHHTNGDHFRTAFTVTVDAREGVTTGISAYDRAHTIRMLADPKADRDDFVRPGHVLPLRAREGGVLRRPGHTEAAVDLARLAGLSPAGVLCEIVSQKVDGEMARGRRAAGVRRGPRPHDDHDRRPDRLPPAHREARGAGGAGHASRPPHGEFTAFGFDSLLDGIEHIAMVIGGVGEGRPGCTARTCWCGCTRSASPATCSARCAATAAPSSTPRSPRWPPRAAGWCSTCAGTRAAASACCTSCRPTSCRRRARTPSTPTSRSACPPTPATTASARRSSWTSGCARCGCSPTTRTSGPGLEGYGLTVVGRVPLPVRASPENLRYLRTKRDRMGHDLPDLDDGRRGAGLAVAAQARERLPT